MSDQRNMDPIAIADALIARRDPDRLIRISEVVESVGLSTTTIYRRIAAGSFPAARDLGGGVIRWRQGDVDDWKRALPVAKHRA